MPTSWPIYPHQPCNDIAIYHIWLTNCQACVRRLRPLSAYFIATSVDKFPRNTAAQGALCPLSQPPPVTPSEWAHSDLFIAGPRSLHFIISVMWRELAEKARGVGSEVLRRRSPGSGSTCQILSLRIIKALHPLLPGACECPPPGQYLFPPWPCCSVWTVPKLDQRK